ncbi:MAG TPA: acyl-CoA dehydrogenase family protein [Ferruginibacter sp.]|nr:acyl-CoA dehydrogenase family protein [Ferruginibacter sp.]
MITDKINTDTKSISSDELLETAKKIGPFLNQFIDEEESNRRPSSQVLSCLRENGLFRLFMPKSLDGIETDPLTTAKVVEEVSRHNTGAGWSLMVANTSTWWCNRFPDKGIEEIYRKGPDTFIAGALHPPMKATPSDGGYIINGRSPLTSNVHEAHWIFVTAFVMEGEQMKMNNGLPVLIGALMNAGKCGIIDTWYTLGMKGTDSNDIEAKNVFVPEHLSFFLTPEYERNQHYKSPLYKFPAIGASIASLIAPVALAVASNAISELKDLAGKKVPFGSQVSMKEKGTVQRKLGMAEAFVQSSRAYLHNTITESWNKTLAGERLSPEDRAGLLLAITHTNQSCLQAVDLVYSAAGSSAIYNRSKISRYFSDAQVIRQHGFANDSRYETAGQLYLGLFPDLPVVMF